LLPSNQRFVRHARTLTEGAVMQLEQKPVRLLTTFFALACCGLAASASEPQEVTPILARAHATVVILPTFPEGESLKKYPTMIEIRGTVTDKGRFESPVYRMEAGDEEFVKAVSDVLDGWRFRPAVDSARCAPGASQAVLKVYFQLDDGKPILALPKIEPDLSAEKAMTEAQAKARVPLPKELTMIKKPDVRFPRDARVMGVEGTAEILFKLNAAGEIIEPTVRYSAPLPQFGEAVLQGMKSAKMGRLENPDERQREASWCIALPAVFCLDGRGASVSDRNCMKQGAREREVGLVLNGRPRPNSVLRGY
jgi:TonB family protein